MATRIQLKGVKKHRKVGKRPGSKSKKSVSEKRKMRLLRKTNE